VLNEAPFIGGVDGRRASGEGCFKQAIERGAIHVTSRIGGRGNEAQRQGRIVIWAPMAGT